MTGFVAAHRDAHGVEPICRVLEIAPSTYYSHAALPAKPEDVRAQYERQLKDLQQADGEAMLEIGARKKLACLPGKDES